MVVVGAHGNEVLQSWAAEGRSCPDSVSVDDLSTVSEHLEIADRFVVVRVAGDDI